MKSTKLVVSCTLLFASIFVGTNVVAQQTTLDHGNGEKTTVSSDKDGSKIDRNGTRESTRETHKEAVDRVQREARERGEKADKQKDEKK